MLFYIDCYYPITHVNRISYNNLCKSNGLSHSLETEFHGVQMICRFDSNKRKFIIQSDREHVCCCWCSVSFNFDIDASRVNRRCCIQQSETIYSIEDVSVEVKRTVTCAGAGLQATNVQLTQNTDVRTLL